VQLISFLKSEVYEHVIEEAAEESQVSKQAMAEYFPEDKVPNSIN